MGKVRVILYGVGAVGSLIAKGLIEKEGVEIVGAIDIAKNKVGKDLGEVLSIKRELGIKQGIVGNSYQQTIENSNCFESEIIKIVFMKEVDPKDMAEYFNVTLELLPYVPELLSDIWALGSSPELIVEMLRSLKLSSMSAQVLDLGCGKGAVAITLAKELGFRIHGVDFFEPFILEATKRSKELGLSSLCIFEQSDIRHISARTRNFDIVVYTAVGGVLGSLDKCVERLRQFIA